MNIAVLMHVESEGPGSLGTFFERKGARVRTLHLFAHDTILPDDPRAYAAIISMGGPMNVDEEQKYPFLRAEKSFLKCAIDAGVPVLGICLGAQLIAAACGTRVIKSPQKEVGWSSVTLTDAGRNDMLFAGLPDKIPVLQWHEDMFEIPAGGVRLAESPACPNQAFRVGKAIGLQFHVEVTRPMLESWFAGSADLPGILKQYDTSRPTFEERATKMYNNFLAAF